MDSELNSILDTEFLPSDPEPFWFNPKSPIFIYGTGTVGRKIGQLFNTKGIPIRAYLDHYTRQKTTIAGVPILTPDSPAILEKEIATVILAIHNREVDMQALIKRLKALGYIRFFSLIDLCDYFIEDLENNYWLTKRSFYREHATQISLTNDLWTDSQSRATFLKTLSFRVTGDFSHLPRPDTTHQYFPHDLPPWKNPIRMIDCGAYDGGVAHAFIRNSHTFSALAAFEPDMQNYAHLVNDMQELVKTIPEITLWPCGVHATSRQCSFSSGNGEASGITDTGETIIHCVALDDALPNFLPTLIKMDIEGAEYDALLGARKLISTAKPGLAISVYHAPAHLWQIPLFINQLARENEIRYTYHLRSHAHNCFDTVFYALPS